MSNDYLPALEREPSSPARAAVIWMHGLGADGYDFADIPPMLRLPDDLPVRFIFPHAPRRPVTLNMGMVMPAWYDIKSLDSRGQDEKGIRESAAHIHRLIEREKERGIASEKIVLGGFSQGGVIALFEGLRHPEKLAGVMVLSSYFALADIVVKEASEANRQIPIFQAHGTHDPMLPVDLGRVSRQRLEQEG